MSEEKTRKPRTKSTGVELEALVFKQCIRSLQQLPTTVAAQRMAQHIASWILDPSNATSFAGGQTTLPVDPNQPTTKQALGELPL